MDLSDTCVVRLAAVSGVLHWGASLVQLHQHHHHHHHLTDNLCLHSSTPHNRFPQSNVLQIHCHGCLGLSDLSAAVPKMPCCRYDAIAAMFLEKGEWQDALLRAFTYAGKRHGTLVNIWADRCPNVPEVSETNCSVLCCAGPVLSGNVFILAQNPARNSFLAALYSWLHTYQEGIIII
jgi:hypothetical protein